MPREGQKFIDNLTHEDRVICVMCLDRGVMHDFTVQYEALIKNKWTEITRIDTSHGYAHQHKFNPNSEGIVMPFVCSNYNDGFTDARQYVKNNYEKLRENYLTQAAKRRL